MMTSYSGGMTRRGFLRAGAAGMAALGIPWRVTHATPRYIPLTPATLRLSPNAFAPEMPQGEALRRLALAAMDAAKSAGAEFADVRVGVQRDIVVSPLPYPTQLTVDVSYGVRARVAGTWGFQHGSVMTADAIASAARGAVTAARRNAQTNQRLGTRTMSALAPTPVVTGEWRSPYQIDPFTVPLDDYLRVIGARVETTARVHRNHPISGSMLGWNAETRVFASTDGSLVTQEVMRGWPSMHGFASLPDHPTDDVHVDLAIPELLCGGFELVLRPNWIETVRVGMETAIRLRELPIRPFLDVGKFPMVFDGISFANLVGMTASPALDGDRLTGLETDASGTTFLTPPLDILGASTPQFSPLITARVDRSLPYANATQWDDEGVAPQPYTLIDRGHVVDYHTTRETAPLLAEWYAKHGRPLRAHGVAVSRTAASVPACTSGHLQVMPASGPASLDALAREIQHGFILRGANGEAEAGLTLATLSGTALEVRGGTIVARCDDVSTQIATKTVLKDKLLALGDERTSRTATVWEEKGMPWESIPQPVTAPAALCKDIDVVTWSIRS